MMVPDEDITTNYRIKLASETHKMWKSKDHLLEFNENCRKLD